MRREPIPAARGTQQAPRCYISNAVRPPLSTSSRS
jgi:hypothetical protein